MGNQSNCEIFFTKLLASKEDFSAEDIRVAEQKAIKRAGARGGRPKAKKGKGKGTSGTKRARDRSTDRSDSETDGSDESPQLTDAEEDTNEQGLAAVEEHEPEQEGVIDLVAGGQLPEGIEYDFVAEEEASGEDVSGEFDPNLGFIQVRT